MHHAPRFLHRCGDLEIAFFALIHSRRFGHAENLCFVVESVTAAVVSRAGRNANVLFRLHVCLPEAEGNYFIDIWMCLM